MASGFRVYGLGFRVRIRVFWACCSSSAGLGLEMQGPYGFGNRRSSQVVCGTKSSSRGFGLRVCRGSCFGLAGSKGLGTGLAPAIL